MKHLAALLLLLATASASAAPHRVILGGALSYTAQGAGDAELIGFGVSLMAQTVSAIAYDGCHSHALLDSRS